MIFVALLRGINVGGKAKVEMGRLKVTFESLGLTDVRTYINSGNVIFRSGAADVTTLQKEIEAALARDFGLAVPVLLRSREQLQQLVVAVPLTWINGADTKCDVVFLWPKIDRPEILEQISHRPGIEDVVYYPGALVWRVDRVNTKPGRGLQLGSGAALRQVTVRNINTVRKLLELMPAE